MKVFLVLLGFLLLGSSPQVLSAPIYYDEAVDGDLASGLPVLLELGVGANRVVGTFSIQNPESEDPSLGSDFDSVLFRVGQGMILQKMQFYSPNTVGIIETAYSLYEIFLDRPGMPRDYERNYLDGSGEATLPTSDFINMDLAYGGYLGAGDYLLHHGYIQYWMGSGIRYADYEWKFIVTPVPEPTALVLLGFGVLGLLAVRKLGSNIRGSSVQRSGCRRSGHLVT